MIIHLGSDFAVRGGRLCRLVKTWPEGCDRPSQDYWEVSPFQVGDRVLLLKIGDQHHLRPYEEGGVPGNLLNAGSLTRRYHGWRGTTNGVAVMALGAHELRKIRELKSGKVSVTLSPDLYPDLP